MPVEIFWENEEQRIIRYNIVHNWTWDDIYACMKQADAMCQSVMPDRVDLIIDMSQSSGVPTNTLAHIRRISDMQQPNAGINVIITRNNFLTVLHRASATIYPPITRYFQLVSRIEDAHAMINKSRERVRA